MGVALFDLDSTLLDCNSGSLWLRHEWRGGRVSWRDAAWGVWVLGQYSLGFADQDAAFVAAVATLAGIEEAAITERTRSWFAAEVRHHLRPGARRVLDEHRASGDRIVLATSSSIYAANEAMSAFALDEVIASRFEVADGRFTGKVASSAFGPAKADRVAEWAESTGVDLTGTTFYTDSVADLRLLERVGKPVAVNPDRRLARVAADRHWPIVDWGRAA